MMAPKFPQEFCRFCSKLQNKQSFSQQVVTKYQEKNDVYDKQKGSNSRNTFCNSIAIFDWLCFLFSWALSPDLRQYHILLRNSVGSLCFFWASFLQACRCLFLRTSLFRQCSVPGVHCSPWSMVWWSDQISKKLEIELIVHRKYLHH